MYVQHWPLTFKATSGSFFLQRLGTYELSSVPEELTIPNERIEEVKVGWWFVYMRTLSNKIFKTRYGQPKTEIKLHSSIGVIRDFFVHIGELYVTSYDNRLFAQGARELYSEFHTFSVNYPVMTEIDISEQSKNIRGIVQIVPRYDGGYMIISRITNPLDIYRVLKKEAFIDLKIIH